MQSLTCRNIAVDFAGVVGHFDVGILAASGTAGGVWEQQKVSRPVVKAHHDQHPNLPSLTFGSRHVWTFLDIPPPWTSPLLHETFS